MKLQFSICRHLTMPTLALCAMLFSSFAAHAQTSTVTPILECVMPIENGRSRIYYGYNNTTTLTQTYLPGSSDNFFSPSPNDRGQPYVFYAGEHRAVFYIEVNFSITSAITWNLASGDANIPGHFVTATANSPQCRTGAITYQGRLSAGGAQASGSYDLQFQLFDAATGGNANSSLISLAGVPVTNGVFTVSLDFGASALTTPRKQFLEIGVRPAGNTGAYTTLAPRQPLTDTPSAVFAYNAENAGYAENANQLGGVHYNQYVQTNDARLNSIQNTTTQQAGANFNISGSGTISGNFGQSTATAFGAGALTVNSATTAYTPVPGLTQTVNVPANAALLISTDGGVLSSGAVNTYSVVDIAVFVDDAAVGQRRIYVGNTSLPQSVGNWALSFASNALTAGNHTIEVRARNATTPGSVAATVSSASDPLLRGQLTIAIIRK